MRRILSDALGREGFDVVATAADGDEALAACRTHRPDALTLDLAMPGLDGLGVLRALREGVAAAAPGARGAVGEGVAEPVPVVVVSAFSPARGAHAVDALAEGAFELVAKPTVGQPMDVFAEELGRKVSDAAQSGRPRRTAPPAAAPVAAQVSASARTGTARIVVIA